MGKDNLFVVQIRKRSFNKCRKVTHMRPKLEEVCEMALNAGEILRDGFGKLKSLKLKREIDVVTEIDRKSEKFLIGEIKSKFPGHHIIAEESGETIGDVERKWYIAPLDGTTNFAHNLPIFSVSIAYAEKDQIVLGVVYDPMRDELFSAEKGGGAKLNGVPIFVGKESELNKSVLVTGFPYDRFTNEDNNLDNFNRLATKIRGIRRLGSAALDLCYVAANRVNGYWEIRMETWDLAAGMLIAQEAGAKVTKRDGSLDMLNPPINVIAANPLLHQKFLENIV